ncbi:HET-domain-containing protein [Decorospora gaudefroyi]|uniref:HET-domain-containing protein n=1 Tax=Decorospora gaudefroyi TaxID=184978 RepID=A0A6A5K414_9PLEO|nr:HET-domain-containing protein [Decorospora gaudefroyi]
MSKPRNCSDEHLLSKEASPAALELDTISCRIFWTPLYSPKAFKALSYTWDSGAFTQTIKVNGKELFITKSLETALRHLRHPSEPVTLWIDQICIDQKNDQEKAEQVGQMGRIYRAAEEVLVWLGPAADDSDKCMDVWKTVGKEAEDWGLMSYYTPQRWPTLQKIVQRVDPEDKKTAEYFEIVKRAMPLLSMQVLKAMAAWCRRPWFTRVWVLQEFGLASTAIFVCGDKRITADQALLAFQTLQHGVGQFFWVWPSSQEEKTRAMTLFQELDPIQTFFATRQRRKGRDAGRHAGDSLCQLLQKVFVGGNRLLATMPCDTVYGVLGIANDTEKLGIQVDYSLKERTDLVYVRTTRAIIKNGNLDILALAQHPKLVQGLPSWVPNWTSTVQKSFAYQAGVDNAPFFSASKDALGLIDTPEEQILGLEGFKVDEIEEIAGIWEGSEEYWRAGDQYEAHFAYLAQIKALCVLSESKEKNIYSSLSRRKEAVWRLPIGDIEETELFDGVRATHASAGAYEASEWGDNAARYRMATQRMKDKRPFITKEGYVGLGPRYMRLGDLVVVFCGAKLPYVVRPLEGGLFRFIGECYCDGIMDGEIEGKRTKEEFLLV